MILGGGGADEVTGSAAADTFVLDHNTAGNDMTVLEFDDSNDKIALDTSGSSTLTGNAFVLAGALANNTNIKAVANAAALSGTTLGQAGFAYQGDTGELYYKADGDFSSGAVLIGVISTDDGTTAWTYSFSAFQVV